MFRVSVALFYFYLSGDVGIVVKIKVLKIKISRVSS